MLAAELLQYVINDAYQQGHFTMPIPHASNDFPVVQYADDTILILKADLAQVQHLKVLLDTFAYSTGLKVNYHKSSMIPINVPDSDITALVSAFGC